MPFASLSTLDDVSHGERVPRISSIRRGAMREMWLAYVVLAAGLVITLLLTGVFLKGVDEREALRAQKQATDVQNRFSMLMARNMTALVGGAALFGVDARLTPAEFENFAHSLQRFGALNGVLAVGFSPRVTASELPRYLATVEQRVPGFHVWPQYPREEGGFKWSSQHLNHEVQDEEAKEKNI